MSDDQPDVGARLLGYALDLADSVGATAVVAPANAFASPATVAEARVTGSTVRFVVFGSNADSLAAYAEAGLETLAIPDVRFTRMGQVKIAVLQGLSRGAVKAGDMVVALTGPVAMGSVDTLTLIRVGTGFDVLSADKDVLPAGVDPEVFERVLQLAASLGHQGREGKAVGTTFVIGDPEEIRDHAHQMVLNPFRGYPESERNIVDSRLAETILEYASLDGAFIVRGDGLLESAGTFLVTKGAAPDLPGGLGARHHSAAAITAATESVAVTVSSSTGNVMVFRRGAIVTELERPRSSRRRSEDDRTD